MSEAGGGLFCRRDLRRSLLWLSLYLLLAVYAPFLAADRPLLVWTDRGLESPVFRHLFDRNLFDSPVDRFFNLLALVLPGGLLVSAHPRLRRRPWLLCGFGLGLHLLLFAACETQVQRLPWTDPAAFQGSWRIAPPIGWSARDVDIRQPSPAPPGGNHLLGTDAEGRDVAARLLFGARTSLTVALSAAFLALGSGTLVGVTAGLSRGWTGRIAARLIDGMLCFPPLFLVLTFAAFVTRPGLFDLLVFIAVGSWAPAARLAYQESRRLRDADFIRAARAQGIPPVLILWNHVLPCILPALRVHGSFCVVGAVLLESTAAFAGLSDPMLPSWGDMLNSGRVTGKIWLILAPGLTIFLLVVLLSRLGEALQERSRSRETPLR